MDNATIAFQIFAGVFIFIGTMGISLVLGVLLYTSLEEGYLPRVTPVGTAVAMMSIILSFGMISTYVAPALSPMVAYDFVIAGGFNPTVVYNDLHREHLSVPSIKTLATSKARIYMVDRVIFAMPDLIIGEGSPPTGSRDISSIGSV